jgi:hypothetical protein
MENLPKWGQRPTRVDFTERLLYKYEDSSRGDFVRVFSVVFILVLSFSAHSRSSFHFFCKSRGWYPAEEVHQFYAKSAGCGTVKALISQLAYPKARDACKAWGEAYKIPNAEVVFWNKNYRENCLKESQSIEDDFMRRTINEVIAVFEAGDPHGTGLERTRYYINNTGIEEPLFLGSGKEQPQWVAVGRKRYCGFVQKDAVFLRAGGRFLVKQLSTGKEFQYRKTLSIDGKEVFMPFRGQGLHGAKKFYHDVSIVFFDNFLNGHFTDVIEYPVYYVEKRKERVCRPHWIEYNWD